VGNHGDCRRFLLIITEYHHEQVRRAGFIYIVATHTGTLLLFVMFAVVVARRERLVVCIVGGYTAESRVGRRTVVSPRVGRLRRQSRGHPFHFWLPPAHAAAPSHVSALMSGVVIKTGVYGLLRVIVLAGPPPAWWGWTVLSLGVLSGVLGVLWALAQHDMKRLLAYQQCREPSASSSWASDSVLSELRINFPVLDDLGIWRRHSPTR